MIKKIITTVVDKLGYSLVKSKQNSLLYEPAIEQILRAVLPYTMTSRERMHALYQAIRYLHLNAIPGDYVECGVWRGGSSMLAAATLVGFGETSRDMYLYDTFEGMSEPGEKDLDFRNTRMKDVWSSVKRDDKVMCYSTLDEVQRNMSLTRYPSQRIHFIKGKVEETIPATIPEQIALLRLDTDWYESTRHELEHLYPRLVPNGVLIIDDYGHWKGARAAVDEYFQQIGYTPLLNAVDYTGRVMVKTVI